MYPRILIRSIRILMLVLVLGSCGFNPESGEDYSSPLSEFTDVFWNLNADVDEQKLRFAQENTHRENLIAQCMLEAGFEYIPNLDSLSATFAVSGSWLPDEREWVAQWGYGILNAPQDSITAIEWNFDSGPNEKYLQGLSALELAAYNLALWGAGSRGEDITVESNGCAGWAASQVELNRPNSIASEVSFSPLIDAIDRFQLSLSTHPAFDEIHNDWVKCMADMGYDGFIRQSDAIQSITDMSNEFHENWFRNFGHDSQTGSSVRDESPERIALAEHEVNLALADLDCRTRTDFQTRYNKVLFTLESQFVSDHRFELETLRSAIEQRD